MTACLFGDPQACGGRVRGAQLCGGFAAVTEVFKFLLGHGGSAFPSPWTEPLVMAWVAMETISMERVSCKLHSSGIQLPNEAHFGMQRETSPLMLITGLVLVNLNSSVHQGKAVQETGH